MKHVVHVTTRDGLILRLEIDARDRRSAAVQAMLTTPGARSASARPVDSAQYVRDQLAERMSGFPLIGSPL